MFRFFFSPNTPTGNDDDLTRRRHARRIGDSCVVTVYGQIFPVINWSFGGVLLTADERFFGIGQTVPLTITFRLRKVVMDIDHSARVVRKHRHAVALEFAPLGQTIADAFRKVIDDSVATEFAESQAT